MPSRACLRCGRRSPEKVCPRCQPLERPKNAPWSKDRNRAEQQRFRNACVAEYGGQCAAVVDGARCIAKLGTHRLQAHHLPDGNGVLLCEKHHAEVDPHARARRQGA